MFCLGSAPEYVDAVKSSKAAEVFAGFNAVDPAEMVSVLSDLCRTVSLTDNSGQEIAPLLYHLSEKDDDLHLCVCNTGVELSSQPMAQPLVRERKLTFPEVKIAVYAAKGKYLYEFDTLTGNICEHDFEYTSLLHLLMN